MCYRIILLCVREGHTCIKSYMFHWILLLKKNSAKPVTPSVRVNLCAHILCEVCENRCRSKCAPSQPPRKKLSFWSKREIDLVISQNLWRSDKNMIIRPKSLWSSSAIVMGREIRHCRNSACIGLYVPNIKQISQDPYLPSSKVAFLSTQY